MHSSAGSYSFFSNPLPQTSQQLWQHQDFSQTPNSEVTSVASAGFTFPSNNLCQSNDSYGVYNDTQLVGSSHSHQYSMGSSSSPSSVHSVVPGYQLDSAILHQSPASSGQALPMTNSPQPMNSQPITPPVQTASIPNSSQSVSQLAFFYRATWLTRVIYTDSNREKIHIS